MSLGLIDKSILIIKADDAKSLLNGLITQDINKLDKNNPIYSLFLTNTGNVLFCTIIYMLEQNTYALEIEDKHLMDLAKHIHKYDISKKAEFSKADDLQVVISDEKLAGFFNDPRSEDLAFRAILKKQQDLTFSKDFLAEYENSRLRLAIPENDDFIRNKSYANDLNCEQFNALNFSKGCYLGQEMTSKTKHIRPTKNSLVCLDNSKLKINKFNQELFIGDKKVGQSFSYNHKFVLAIIKRDISDYSNISTK